MLQHRLLLLYLCRPIIVLFCWGFIALCIFLSFPTEGRAFTSTHQFSARLIVGGDIDPPTIPDQLIATPVSTNQINLEWNASVDNVAVSGYRVFRDSVQIATTTLTSFSDTGLIAETQYSYFIDAFDIFYNYSSSSLVVSTTTLAVPVVPEDPVATTTPSTKNPSSGTVLITAVSFDIIPDQFSAKFNWTTNVPTRYVIRWGRTDSYELGSIYGGELDQIHSTTITDLESATKYFYVVEAVNGYGVRKTVSLGEFVTKGLVSTEAVPNVSQVRVEIEHESVRLYWKNPLTPNFLKVRVVKSHLFYPQHPNDGALVYEGQGGSLFDAEALRDRSPQYYTIFVYDKNGNVSSGALAVAARRVVQEVTDADEEIESEEVVFPPDTPLVVDLFAMNVLITQGSVTSHLHNPQTLNAREPVFISIPVSLVPRHLKSIVVNLTHPSREHEISSYLLKINSDGTAYEAYLPAPMEAGKSKMTVQLYDYELATVRTVSNTVEFQLSERAVSMPWQFIFMVTAVVLLFWVGLLFLWRWRSRPL